MLLSYNMYCGKFFKKYIFERERERENSPVCWFTPQMVAKVRAGLEPKQELGILSRSPL